MRNLQTWTKLRAKAVTKAAECKLIKFFVLAIAQHNSPLFHFLKKLANCVDSLLFHCCYDFKIFRKRSHTICSNFAIIEAIVAGTNSLKRFLKKKTLDIENAKINKKRNGVVMLPWRLRLR